MSSPIRKLTIDSNHVMDPVGLERFLPRLAQSLEKLELRYFCARPKADEVPGSLHFFHSRTQYPTMRSLSIRQLVGPPLLDRLQHLFPA
uniref:Chitin synthase (EC) n=1 Tax=Ganoderma boninense TaxID=34458 RepID=A0A5K1K3E5_9APHY|nr:Chitin synthase (EC [Ganoderma boninense]